MPVSLSRLIKDMTFDESPIARPATVEAAYTNQGTAIIKYTYNIKD